MSFSFLCCLPPVTNSQMIFPSNARATTGKEDWLDNGGAIDRGGIGNFIVQHCRCGWRQSTNGASISRPMDGKTFNNQIGPMIDGGVSDR